MRTGTLPGLPPGLLLVRAALRAAALALLWLVLTDGDLGTWWLGALAVAVATLASLILLPPAGRPWSLLGTVSFVGFFLRQSVVAGVDVARRALGPRPDLDPALVEYTLRLRGDAARVLFANTVSLLPGTLSASLRGRKLLVHTLALDPDLREDLRRTEAVVARMFGVGSLPENDAEAADE